MHVIKDETNDMVNYSPLGNADRPEVDNLPVDKVAQSRKENLAPNKAYRTKGEHSPSDADQTRELRIAGINHPSGHSH